MTSLDDRELVKSVNTLNNGAQMGFSLPVSIVGMRLPLDELRFCYLLDTSKLENIPVFIGGIWLRRSRQGIIGGISVVLKNRRVLQMTRIPRLWFIFSGWERCVLTLPFRF